MASLRTFPEDALTHEKESLSKFLREFEECPEEVRIRRVEGAFFRPSLFIYVASAGIDDESLRHYYSRRVGTIMYYGSEDKSGDKYLEADRAAEWITQALVRGHDGTERGVIRIYDYSDETQEVLTDYWIEIDSDSVDARPIQDDYDNWFVPVDFRYRVERGDSPSGTIVTTIIRTF